MEAEHIPAAAENTDSSNEEDWFREHDFGVKSRQYATKLLEVSS
jgi:hypothetical protein